MRYVQFSSWCAAVKSAASGHSTRAGRGAGTTSYTATAARWILAERSGAVGCERTHLIPTKMVQPPLAVRRNFVRVDDVNRKNVDTVNDIIYIRRQHQFFLCKLESADMKVVGLSEVAELFGVTKQVAANWKNRRDDFPKPIAELKSGPVWSHDDIAAWAAENDIKIGEVVSDRPCQLQASRDDV